MAIYPIKTQFGWEGDEGLGERLIARIIDGSKRATNCPKIFYSEAELKELFESAGQLITVIDKNGEPRCNVRQVEVFETTFGNPNPRLVAGEGFEDNVEAFQKAHLHVWDNLFAEKGCCLQDDTILIAEIFELVECEN